MYEYVSHLVWKFGISRVQAQVYANQKACAVCARVPNERLRVDHNHVTGQIRGVVCRQCNLALSTLDGDPAWIDSLQRYLAQTNQR
jgi:hypothetical protein